MYNQQQAAPAQNTVGYQMQEAGAMESGKLPYVDESGAYVLSIKRAEYVRAKTGSHGLQLHLESADGRQANYVDLYYQREDGSRTFQANFIDAMLWLMGLPSFSWQQQNGPAGHVTVAPELLGKQIGLVLEHSHYNKQGGGTGSKLEVRQVFDPSSGKTAKEIKENSEARAVGELLAKLI